MVCNISELHVAHLVETKDENKSTHIIYMIVPITKSKENAIDHQKESRYKWSNFDFLKQFIGNIIANTRQQKAPGDHLNCDIVLLVGRLGGGA